MDRDALRIWFATWPLLIPDLLKTGNDPEKRKLFFQMNGQFELNALADTSHRFLYGHRYWSAVKRAVDPSSDRELYSRILAASQKSGVASEFSLAMSAIAHMTLEQCGPEFLAQVQDTEVVKVSADELQRRRATASKPSFMERLKGKSSSERVIFDEARDDGWFPILATQDITTAAELDKRAYHESDRRCYEGMGPIPVDCRSGSCGTCWVGILGGNENLDPVEEFERKRIEYFGYWDSGFVDSQMERPIIRLACQTKANASVTIAIPPWNGVFGRVRREKELAD